MPHVSTLLALVVAAGPAWTPAGRSDVCDARWYTRAVPGHAVHELKATGLVRAPVDDVFAVLLDFEGYQRTMPSTTAARVLSRDGDASAAVYLRYDVGVIAPRDSVVRMTWGRGETSRWLRWVPAPDGDTLAPPVKGAVRIPVNEGSWTLEPRGESTFVVYHLLSSPGGDVPAFLVNAINGAGVPQTLEALERAAKQRSQATGARP